MKIHKMFVATTPDGQFLNISEHSTHTGHHVNVRIVSDIEQASAFCAPRYAQRSRHVSLPEHTWVPVEVRREVILLEYGVPAKEATCK